MLLWISSNQGDGKAVMAFGADRLHGGQTHFGFGRAATAKNVRKL
jgi:hypothetical protein